MRTIERVAVFVAAVLVLASSLGLWGYLGAWFAPGQLIGVLESASQSGDLFIVAILLTALGLALLFFALGGSREAKAVITESSLGQVRVSMAAIDSLVRKAAGSIRGVREIDTKLSVDKLGLNIGLRLLVATDLSLPELTAEVQKTVGSYIDETVGITPKQINVLVRNVAGPGRARVE
jgi:uncharacterized alkaline shock family protein YloU